MSTLPPSSALPVSYLHEYTDARLTAVAIAFIPVEILFVGLRHYSRHLHKTPIGLDDILIVPALIFCLILDGLGIGQLCFVVTTASSSYPTAMTKYGGVGRHLLALEVTDPAKIVAWAKLLIAIDWIYLAAVTFPKLCILSIYLRIFTTKPYRVTVYILAVTIILTFIGGGLAGSLRCQPLAFFWDHTIPGGRCFNTNAFHRWISLPNIFTDVAMLVLPLPFIWALHMTKNQKMGLTVTFLTGSVGLIASIFRFTNFFRNDAITDGTFSSVELVSWTIVEPGVYLIAACLPTLRPLIQRVLQSTRSSDITLKCTRDFSDSFGKRSTVGTRRVGQRGAGSTLDQSPCGFQRLADGHESLGKSAMGDERNPAYDCRSEAEVSNYADKGGNYGPAAWGRQIHVKHDFEVTTSGNPESVGP